jgi:hypothetical protein
VKRFPLPISLVSLTVVALHSTPNIALGASTKSAPAKEVAGVDFSIRGASGSKNISPILDGGSVGGVGDFSLYTHLSGGYFRLFGTAASWKRDSTTDAGLRLDTAGLELGVDSRHTGAARNFSIKLPAGIYYPMEWKEDYSKLYQIPRVYLGATLQLDIAPLHAEGGLEYFWPAWKSGSIDVDNVSLKVSPAEYWQAKLSGSIDILGIIQPLAEVGMFHFGNTAIEGPMELYKLDTHSISYASFGVGVVLNPNTLSIEARSHRVLGKADKRSEEYTSGRRAISELYNSFSLGIVGSL